MTTNDKLAGALRAIRDTARCEGLKLSAARVASTADEALAAHAASLAAPPAQGEWAQGAPSKPWSEEWFIAVTTSGDRVVLRALPESYTYDFTTADDTHIKRDRIAKWMQFPDSEFIAPQPAPAPVQVDVLGELADEIEATYPNADASNLRAFAADAQPPAPGEAELPPLPDRFDSVSVDDFTGQRLSVYTASQMEAYARAAIAALAQQRVDLEQFRGAVSLLHLTCRRRLRDVRKGVFPAHYLPIFEQDLAQASALLDLIDQQQEARGNGE